MKRLLILTLLLLAAMNAYAQFPDTVKAWKFQVQAPGKSQTDLMRLTQHYFAIYQENSIAAERFVDAESGVIIQRMAFSVLRNPEALMTLAWNVQFTFIAKVTDGRIDVTAANMIPLNASNTAAGRYAVAGKDLDRTRITFHQQVVKTFSEYIQNNPFGL